MIQDSPDFSQLYHRLQTFSNQTLTTFEKGEVVKRSYGQLHEEVERIIDRMSRAGVHRSMRLGLISENRYEWLLYDWAMAAMGCVSVVFLEGGVQRGLAYLMEEYELSLLVITRRLVNDPLEKGLLVLDEPAQAGEAVRSLPPGSLQKRADELTNCFSTGTGGVSKGLIVSEKGLARLVIDCLDLYGLGEGDRILVFMPLTAFQQRLFTYAGLLKGLSIIMVNPLQLFKALRMLEPTLLIGPPSLFETVHEQIMTAFEDRPEENREAVTAKLRQQFGEKMKIMLCGMAKVSPNTLHFFKQAGLPLYEVYGLSETGLVGANTPQYDRVGTVGRPFVGARVRINDEGEVLVSKPNFLSLGYFKGMGSLREPEWFGEWFATGDMGSMDEDGYLTLSGRKDNLIVSSSGHNIQPEVIEKKLEEIPGVKRAVIFAVPHQPTLSAVLELTDTASGASIEEAAETLNRSLESWCQVGHLVHSQIPFTTENGLLNRGLKLDRGKIYKMFKSELELNGEQDGDNL